MKHTKKKKLLAFVLCMVLVLSTAITAFAVDGNFYYVPKDTVELSHEIMKDGASQGTLYATVPGGTFKSSTDNAELQMDMQEETSESTVLEAVQTELENTGNTGYTVHQAVMGDVSFRVSTEDKAQIPEKAVNFRFENTSLDTAHAMGFVYDSSDETITLYELKEDTLQFEEDVKLETETVVVGCFDVLEKTAEDVSDNEWSGSTEGTLLANMLGEDEKFTPGKRYNEAISVKNSGNIDTFVRVILTRSWQDAEGKKNTSLSPDLIELNYLTDNGWVIAENQSTPERTVLYYTKALPVGETTPALSDTIRVNESIAQDVTKQVDGNTIRYTYKYDGYSFHVDAEVDAVQTHNAQEAIKSAWGVDVSVNDDETVMSLQ